MAKKILKAIHDHELAEAANIIKDTYAYLQARNQGITAPSEVHRNRLDDVIANPADEVDIDDMIDTFNYYIYKICDYPRNLF